MNATIQEIEGIDDYWGPAFRSVYEGEGHEAFVQQLDERIVQHDKEIEKLCNFHYQPEKRKRQGYKSKEHLELAGASREPTEGSSSMKPQPQRGHCETSSESNVTRPEKYSKFFDEVASSYDDNNSNVAKRRRLDPKRLGGYSNLFPEASSSQGPNMSASAYKTHNLDASARLNDSGDESFCYDGYTDGTPELNDVNEDDWVDWNSPELSSEECEDISKYHSLAEQQKSQKLISSKEPNDLRVYLRNRKRGQEQTLSTERSRRGRSRSKSDEPLCSNRRDPSDKSASTCQYDDTSSQKMEFHKRPSRHDPDDSFNRESYYRYHSPSHHNSAEREYRDRRRQASANNSDRASNESHSDKIRNHYRHASTSHRGKLTPDRHYDQRCHDINDYRRHSAVSLQDEHTFKKHNGSQGRHDSTERQYRENHYGPANQREHHFGQMHYDFAKRQSGNRRYATAARVPGDHMKHNKGESRYAAAHQGRKSSPNERQYCHSNSSSTERQNGDRRDAHVSLQKKERYEYDDRQFGQRRSGFNHNHDDHNRDESRHASTNLPKKECMRNARQFAQRRYDSDKLKNLESSPTSANQARYFGLKLHGSSDYQGDKHQASTSPQSQGESQNGNRADASECRDHHQALVKNGPTPSPSDDLRSYLRSKTTEVDGMLSGSDPRTVTMQSRTDLGSSNNRGIEFADRDHIGKTTPDTCNEFDGNHPTQSSLMSTAHHIVENCVESAELHHSQLNQSQNGGLSAKVYYSPNRAMSEIRPNQSHSLSAEFHSSKNRSLSSDLQQGQNRSLSAELQNQSRSLLAEFHNSGSHSTSAKNHFDECHPVSTESCYDKRCSTNKHHNDEIGNASTEFQQNCEKRKTSESGLDPSELKTNHSKPDAESNPNNSTSSKERSIDLDATIEITMDDSPMDRYVPRGEKLNDSKSQLSSYLETKLTCRREKCAAVPRSCGPSAEPERCSSELRLDNTNRITTESSVHKETARQCSTPVPDVKTEPNGNAFDEMTDTSAIVSDKISTDCHPDQNFVANQCQLLENIVKLEPNDNSSDPEPSILEIASADCPTSKVVLAKPPAQSMDSPKQIPLTVYSKRHPPERQTPERQAPELKTKKRKRKRNRSKKPIDPASVSHESTECHPSKKTPEPDTKAESAAHNSLNTAISGQTTMSNSNDAAQASHKCNKLLTNDHQPSLKKGHVVPEACQNNSKENEQNAMKCLSNSTQRVPSAKECQFNVSVRDIKSINSSSKPSSHANGSTDAFVPVDSFRLDPLNTKEASELNNNSVNAVTNHDSRLQPRQNCNSTIEDQRTPQNPVGCKSQPNNNVLTTAASHEPMVRPRHYSDNLTSQNHILAKISSLPDFDPSNKHESITAWLCRVNEIAVTCKWTDQQVIQFAMSKLVGNAKRWYEGFTSNLSWIEWQNKLEATFPFEENYGKMLSDMLNKTAKNGDSLEDYFIEKMVLLNRCCIRGKRATECIIFGIEDEAVRTKAEGEKFSDPDKLLEYLRNLTKSSVVEMELLYNDLLMNP